jgi:hypothetical protein
VDAEDLKRRDIPHTLDPGINFKKCVEANTKKSNENDVTIGYLCPAEYGAV